MLNLLPSLQLKLKMMCIISTVLLLHIGAILARLVALPVKLAAHRMHVARRMRREVILSQMRKVPGIFHR